MRFRLLLAFLALATMPAEAQDTTGRYAGDWQVTTGDGGTGMCRVAWA